MLNCLTSWFCADLAIDLGTANTLVAVAGEGLLLNEPSVVAVEQGTRRVLSRGCAVGHLAQHMLGRTPESIAVVRPLRDGAIADYQLCESMLRYLLRKALRGRRRGRPRTVVAIPAGTTPVERRAVYSSLHRAGAGQVYLLSAAKAAALGCGLPIAEPVASMVCDIGCGTTEGAVMSLGESVASSSVRVGGDAMDRAIVEYLRRNYSLRVSVQTAERLRIDIGCAYRLPVELSDEVSGLDAISGLPRKATVTSEEVREALAGPLETIIDAVKATLDECGPDLAADLMAHGLVLAGGGALVRGIDRLLAERTGLPVRLAGDPLAAVAAGAQVCLEHFSQWRGILESGDDEA
jgi:rod shape-determining protein MreB